MIEMGVSGNSSDEVKTRLRSQISKLFLQNKMGEVPPSVVSMVLPPLSLTKL